MKAIDQTRMTKKPFSPDISQFFGKKGILRATKPGFAPQMNTLRIESFADVGFSLSPAYHQGYSEFPSLGLVKGPGILKEVRWTSITGSPGMSFSIFICPDWSSSMLPPLGEPGTLFRIWSRPHSGSPIDFAAPFRVGDTYSLPLGDGIYFQDDFVIEFYVEAIPPVDPYKYLVGKIRQVGLAWIDVGNDNYPTKITRSKP